MTRYLPSVFQIRWKSCKGILIRNPQTPEGKIQIRPSMEKFKCAPNVLTQLGIVACSHPYSYGHLNKQYIQILSGLGVRDEVFFELQQAHFKHLQNFFTDLEVMLFYLVKYNKIREAELLLKVSYALFFLRCFIYFLK